MRVVRAGDRNVFSRDVDHIREAGLQRWAFLLPAAHRAILGAAYVASVKAGAARYARTGRLS